MYENILPYVDFIKMCVWPPNSKNYNRYRNLYAPSALHIYSNARVPSSLSLQNVMRKILRLAQEFLTDTQGTCAFSPAWRRWAPRNRTRVLRWIVTRWSPAKRSRATSIAANSWWYPAEMVTRTSAGLKRPPNCKQVVRTPRTTCCCGKCDTI